MKLSILIALLSIILLANSQITCGAGQQLARFLDGDVLIFQCINTSDVVPYCSAYNYNDLIAPYHCLYCTNGRDLVTYVSDVSSISTQCLLPFRPILGCNVYWNTTKAYCFGCQAGYNTIPLVGTYNGIQKVQCTQLNLIIGDGGITQSKCNNYAAITFLNAAHLVCVNCSNLANGDTTVAADCSAYCKTQSGKFHVTALNSAGVKTQTCSGGFTTPAQSNQCELYDRFKINCLSCRDGFSLVLGQFLFFPISYCIPTSQVIPGCNKYFLFDYNICIACNPSSTNPGNLTFFYQYQICTDSPSNIIANCTQFGVQTFFAPNGLSKVCIKCQFGFWPDRQKNRCVKFVFHCQDYSDSSGLCLRCIPGYYILNQVCTEVKKECISYDQYTGVCKECITGYLPSPKQLGACIIDTGCPARQYFDGSSCQPGQISNCLAYQIGGQNCISCDSGYQVGFGGVCDQIKVDLVCPADTEDYKYVIQSGVCVQTPIECVGWLNDGYCYDCGQNALGRDGECYPL